MQQACPQAEGPLPLAPRGPFDIGLVHPASRLRAIGTCGGLVHFGGPNR